MPHTRLIAFGLRAGSMRAIISLVFAAVLAMGCASRLQAQALYGTVVGNIVDSTQSAVPAATVRIADPSTGVARDATTTEKGEYIFSNVPVGTYVVTVNHQGFKEAVRKEVPVGANQTIRVDLALELGAVSERIEISGEAAALQTDRAEVRGEVANIQYRNLPVPPSRNYEQLLSTIPGVTPVTTTQSASNSPSNPGSFTINGQTGATRSTRIDGAAEVNVWLAGAVAYIPSLESIQAVNVVTNSVDAETGGAAGGAVTISIKSGTNQFHGSLFENHSDAALLAKPAILPAGIRKPGYTFNQFGGSIGGPVKRDKLFFFLSYDGTYSRRSSGAFYTVPTAAQKTGNLSTSSTTIYDPNTGTPDGRNRAPFDGNIIPAARFDPIMPSLLAELPLPNVSGIVNNYFVNTPNNRDTHVVDAKINWNPTAKMTTYARLGLVGAQAFVGNTFDTQGIGGPIEGGNIWGKTYSTTYAATYALNPRLLFDGNIGWTEMTTNIEQLGIGANLGQNAGIPGTNGPARYQSGWPQFVPDTYTAFGTNAQWMPWHRWDPQYNYTGNVTWVHGGHQVRLGGELVIQALNHEQAEYTSGGTAYGAQGGFGFRGQLTTLNGGPASNQFNSMASMLMGLVSSNGKNVLPSGLLTTRQKFYSAYIRDQWQVSSKLTANLGVRWEYYPLLTRGDRGVEVFNFASNTMSLCGYASVPQNCGVDQNKFTFGPRAGLAYRVTPTFVIRAGYSLAYDPSPLVRQFRGNYPALISYFVQSGANNASAFQPISLLKDGIAPVSVPSLGNGIIPVPGNISIATVQSQFRRGYLQNWNLTLEKQLTSTITGSVGYVATRANGILNSLDANAGDIGCNAACQPLNVAFGRTAVTNVVLPIGNSHFDSLQARVQQRFAGGYSLGLSYTWSKTIALNQGYALPKYGYLYRGVTNNPPYYLNFNGSYELPFGAGKPLLTSNRIASLILGGWQVNGIFSVNAGARFGIVSNSPLNAVNGPSQRANVAGPIKMLGGLGPGNNYFDPASFVAGPANQIGNAGPNILRGPTSYNLDGSVFRKFRITERIGGEIHAEAFNTTNTPHWGNPGGNVSVANYAQITSTRATGREVGDQRQLQFGVRFTF